MKLLLKALPLALFAFLVTGQFAVKAQGPANRVMGSVTAVDTTANTITVQGRGQDATATTVKVTTDTKYSKPVKVALSTLAVGDAVRVQSATAPADGDTSVDARSITVLDALPPAPPAGAPAYGGRRGGTTGTVVTTTPSLTIKTVAGVTLTVNTTDATTVAKIEPAALTDIAVGNNVMIMTTTDATGNVTAKSVAVQPARMRRGGGGGAPAGGGAAGA